MTHSRNADERGTVTADPAGQELTFGERVDYTRAHLPATQRERYEQELREATERALDTSDYGPLGNVVERWWRAARLEDHGASSWQRQKRLAEKGRWDELDHRAAGALRPGAHSRAS